MKNTDSAASLPKNRTTVRNESGRKWLLEGVRIGFRVLNKTAPDLASMAAERLFRSPRRHRRPAWEQESLTMATPHALPWGAETLPAWSWGQGPTVLLVHGWEGRGSQLSAFVGPLLDMGFRVVAFDAPGHGDGPGQRATMIEIASAVTAALAALGPVHAIVAHSVGCVATTYALARAPGQSPRLVFVAPPTSPLAYTRMFARMVGIDEDVRRRMVGRLEARYGVPLADLDAGSTAPSMRAPLLVVHDRDDHEVPFETGAGLSRRWPGARLVDTRGLGHRRVLRSPQVIGEAVQFVVDAPWSARTGLGRFGLERELFERDHRGAA